MSVREGHRFAMFTASYVAGIIASMHAERFVVAALCIAGFAAIVPSRYRPAPSVLRLILIACLCFAIGDVAATVAQRQRLRPPFAAVADHYVTLRAVALERPRLADTASMRVRIVGSDGPSRAALSGLSGRVALLSFPIPKSPQRWAGRILRVRCRVALPGGARNDGEPDERDVLGEQGIDVILIASRASQLHVFGAAGGWEAAWARARERIADALERELPALEAIVLEGILWGDRGNLPAGLRQEFSDTGTVHVLTTAGLHLGIMAGFVAAVLMQLPLPRSLRTALMISAAWGYATLAGMHLPTLRAAAMLSAGTLAHELGRGRTTSAVLAAAACAVVLPHPLAALSPAFSMSFACVCGIALVNPLLTALGLGEDLGLPHFVVEVLRTSLAVQIALWPLQALYFNAFTPYAVLANAIVVPMVGAVMAGGALLCVASLVGLPLTAALTNLTWWALDILIEVVKAVAALPAAHVDMSPPSHAFIVAYWAALAALALGVRTGVIKRQPRRLVLACASVGALLTLLYCLPAIGARLDQRLFVDAIDVGQADCLLIRAPGGHALLVDGGGRLERSSSGSVVAAPIGDRLATRTVMPFLMRHWVHHLDAVVMTHPHGDHVGGMPVILARERVDTVYDSGQLYTGPAYLRTLEVVRDHHIQWVRAQRGVAFALGPAVLVNILAPELPLISGTSSDINNNSVVLRLMFGRVAMLLTGDAQAEAETRLLSHGAAELRADILKVGHHGSAYSSTPEFLAAVQPKIALISCGLHNVFGHPSARTLTALEAVGARVYRTDQDGGISISSNGFDTSATSVISRP